MNRTTVAPVSNAENYSPVANGLLQRKCTSCGSKTVAQDECTNCSKKKNSLQTKLSIGVSNDPLEHEADRVAEQVISRSSNSAISNAPVKIQRLSNSSSGSGESVPSSVNSVLSSSGSPMQTQLRQDMEQRFGYDFSQVRIHTGSAAEQSAREINAHAYTAGNNIVFAEGQYTPETQVGRRLIAHELTHTVQQNSSNFLNDVQRNATDINMLSANSKTVPIIQRQEDDDPATSELSLQDSTSETSIDSPSMGQMEEVRPGNEPRILISCADMRFKIVTPATIYSYQLEECSIPINSYIARVTVTDNDFHLDFGDNATTDEEFSFRYRVDPDQINPATLLTDINRIQVDVVENLPPPPSQAEQEQQPPPTTCVMQLDDHVLVPSNSETRSLFETKTFEQTLWAHSIPLGQFGWVEVEASASGSLNGNLSGSYGPGRLTNICLTHMTDRQDDSAPIDHILLGRGSRADVSTFALGGRARFSMPARAAINLAAAGTINIAGDYLSVIELAAAEATLSASAGATLTGNINGSVEIVARATRSEATLEHPILPLSLSIENSTIDGVDLAAEIGLQGRAGVSFRGDLTAGFDLAGINLWSQTWNLASFNAGISWAGGLRYSPNPGVHWDLGAFSIGDDNSDDEPLSSDIHEDSAEIDTEDIIDTILNETHTQVANPDGSDESQALPFTWFKPDSLYPTQMNLPNATTPTSVGRFDGPTTVRFPAILLPSRDRPLYNLPRSPAPDPSVEIEEDFGVADWPSIHSKFQYMPYDSRSDPEKERFKRLVDALGFDRSGFDADHIWELGLRGLEYDRFDNLWPGSNQEQQLAGSRHSIQMRNYETTLDNINGRWFVISRIQHPA